MRTSISRTSGSSRRACASASRPFAASFATGSRPVLAAASAVLLAGLGRVALRPESAPAAVAAAAATGAR
jgi:hypothetical protein